MFGTKEKKLTIKVQGMTCHHCEMTVEKALKEIENVRDVKANREKGIIEIRYENEIELPKLKNKIIERGYKVSE
jgi:Cu2+-exporting ATPase